MASHVVADKILQGIFNDESDKVDRPESVSNFISEIGNYLSYCEAWGSAWDEIVDKYTEAQLVLFSFISTVKNYQEEDSKDKKKKSEQKSEKVEGNISIEKDGNKSIIKPTKRFKDMTSDEYTSYVSGAAQEVNKKVWR